MKRLFSVLLALILLCCPLSAIPAYAIGDGNVDGGGGGMGDGTSTNSWTPGNEGVRVTVIRASDHAVVTTPIDLTNKAPSSSIYNFGKVSKLQYNNGQALSPVKGGYSCVKPVESLPKIISTNGTNNIAAIKSYFTDEQVIRSIANLTGMDFDVLTDGDYRLLLEPIAYYKFEGVMIATTATEAALYDKQVGGLLRSRMVSLSHKNLPLAMFLEVADLGYPAWSGSTSTAASDADIISSLGLGIVRFKDAATEPPNVSAYNYEYRVNTEVITSVMVSGGQSDPDHPVTVTFNVGGKSMRVSNVYYPEGDSQIAWIRWTTPSTPQTMTIPVTVSGGGSTRSATITAKIVDLSGNDPPNPIADDRNDSYSTPSVPSKAQKTSASWSVWRPWWKAYWVWHSDWNWYGDGNGGGHWEDDGEWVDEGWWEFDLDQYRASLSASMKIQPDEKSPTASGKTMKSGYGINQTVNTNVSTNQSSAVTGAQNAVTYFPEFGYQTYWRLLERMGSSYNSQFEFQKNPYSTYDRRTHFTPLWFPDGSYTPYTWLIDCWTPDGMLSMNLTDSVTIRGNLWSDWHIAVQNPD
ncbi:MULTISPECIES: hypothetical protein [Caproicibacterium]|jgi:hypothetical protein|uniref:Uncharacterized protein n=1 Tax=Caproicibacterium argilliputei TaxID=3030016 RepID=A0AA97H2D8_9FIRM|nr:hypothetical protein [Caproicibacterium argilliputei]WOC32117.1 hypothetical protein PXC00_13115 [Caproicibacterium argilliputei]